MARPPDLYRKPRGGPSCNVASLSRANIAERDQRAAADDRTAAERWFGDPPRMRSALANMPVAPRPPTRASRGLVQACLVARQRRD